MMADLSTTIGSLRSELGRAQSNLSSNNKIKDTIQEQYEKANETIQIQVILLDLLINNDRLKYPFIVIIGYGLFEGRGY